MNRFLLLLLFSLSPTAHGYFENGTDLIDEMREYEKASRSQQGVDYAKASEFRGYITAAYDSLSLSQELCGNGEVTKAQIGAIVSNFLNANPGRWNEPALNLVRDAIRTAFPCNRE